MDGSTALLPAAAIDYRGAGEFAASPARSRGHKRADSFTLDYPTRQGGPSKLSKTQSIRMVSSPEQASAKRQNYIDADRGRGRPKISVVEERERAKLSQYTKTLQLRLQYAKLKVEHGWSRQSLNEVENLYFCHKKINTEDAREPEKDVPKLMSKLYPFFEMPVAQNAERQASPPKPATDPKASGSTTSPPKRRRAIVLANPALTQASIEAAQGKETPGTKSYADFWKRLGDRTPAAGTSSSLTKAHAAHLQGQQSSATMTNAQKSALELVSPLSHREQLQKHAPGLRHPVTPPEQVDRSSHHPTPAPTPGAVPSVMTAQRLISSRNSPTPIRSSQKTSDKDILSIGTVIERSAVDNGARAERATRGQAEPDHPTGLMSPRSPEEAAKLAG